MTLKQLTVKTFARLAVLLTVALCAAVGAVQVSAEAGGQSGLNPSFDPLTLNYTATVPHDVTEVTFDLRAQHPKATVTVNGGDPSTLVQLAVGENTIKIVVTAEDARYTRTYTIVVTRLEAKANEAPTVASGLADATIANQSGTQRVSLSGVFSDADGDDLTIKARSSNESVATVAVSNDTLTVTARSLGVANITVTASDGEDEVSDSFTVTVKSAPVVSAPIADINELEAEASREISLSGVFSDADGDALRISAATSDRAIVNISAALDGATLSATAVTVIGVAEGTATITVTAQDSDGNSVSDTFDVTVPAAQAQQQQQVDAVPGQVVNLSLRQTQPTRIRVEWQAPEDGGAVNSYQVVLSRDGEELSTRRPGAKKRHVVIRKLEPGASYTVSVRAKNATGLGPVDTAQITLTASVGDDDPAEVPAQQEQQASAQQQQQVPVNQPPTVAAPISDISGLKPGATRPVSLTGAFQDADGDTLTISAKSSAAAVATVSVATDGASLSVTAVATGAATITVSADDGNGGTVSDSFTVTVEAANTAPTVASAIGDITGLRRGDTRQVSLADVFNDADGDALTITAQSSAAAAVTASVAPGGASLMIAALSEGAATITVTAADGNGGTVADSFTVTVAGNQAPTVAAPIGDISGVKPGATRVVSLSGVFADAEGDALTLTARTSNRSVATVAADGASLTVTAVAEGTATITVSADDGNGGTVSDSFTVTVVANAAPTVASAISDISGLKPGRTRQVSLAGVFQDAESDSLTISARSSAVAVATVSVAASGASLTVTGVAQGGATITVTANDGRGGTVSDRLTVTVVANAPPTLVSPLGDISGLKPGATRTVSLAGVFRDPNGDALTLTARSADESVATVAVAAGGGSLTVTGVSGGTATITVSADDGDGATALDSFTVEVDLANAKATLAAPNAAPTVASAIGDLSGLKPGATRTVSLTGVFQDADGDALTITAQSSAAAVARVSVVSGGASLTVTAAAEGTATITVTANDGKGGTVSDSFTVTVEAANAAPRVASAMGDLSGLRQGDTRQVLLSNVFQDADGDALTFSARSSNSAVASVASANAGLTVTAVAEGTATVTVTASDGKGGTVSDSFTVTVAAANAAPRAVRSMDDVNGLTAGTTRRVLVADHFRDADNDPLTLTASSSNVAVVRVLVDGRNYSMTLSAVSAGTATITVTADDGQGGRASASFRVTVNAAPESEPKEQDSGLEGEPEQELVVQDVITRYDTNGDGEISLDEYNAAIPDLGTTLSFADLLKLRAAFQASSR